MLENVPILGIQLSKLQHVESLHLVLQREIRYEELKSNLAQIYHPPITSSTISFGTLLRFMSSSRVQLSNSTAWTSWRAPLLYPRATGVRTASIIQTSENGMMVAFWS